MSLRLTQTTVIIACFAIVTAGWTSAQDRSILSKSDTKVFSRPEEHGEDFSRLSTSDAVTKFGQSKDRIERRKLAKIIGDRSKNGQLAMTQQEGNAVWQIVLDTLQQAKSPDANDRAEARQQIERLWHAAVPTLIAGIQTNDMTMAELAAKSLILMRDEKIVRMLIQETRATKDDGRRNLLVFTLSKMKEQRKSLIPDRECMGEKESEELFDRLVSPALTEFGSGPHGKDK